MPKLSPDGGLLVYRSDDSGRSEIYIKPFPSGEGKWQVSVDGGRWPQWGSEGDKLFFVWDEKLYEVKITTDPALRLSAPRVVIDGTEHKLLLEQGYGVGRERLVAVQKMEREEQDGEEATVQQGIFVVQNWLAELQ
jgi:serine/threonine-protein kinase